jgi:hypothetical protein
MTDVGYVPANDGQLGIPGTAIGAVVGKGKQIFYVDPSHTNADDAHYGTDPEAPLATLQSLIDRTTAYMAGTGTTLPVIESYDTVYVCSSLTETVTTADYDVMPSYVTLAGVGNGRYSPAWQSEAVDEVALDLRCVGWRVTGFRFYGQTSAACIELHHTDLGGNDIAIRTIIDHNYFDGLTTGETGIESHGCYDVWVMQNTFNLWNNGGNTAAGMRVTTTPLAIPYRNYVVGNIFADSDNGCIWPSNGSFFWNNMFQPTGYAYSMVQVLNTSLVANPGDDNMVWGNTFPGDYSIAGGYRGGAADAWLGNWADDIAEPEVGDNGITILPPA